MVTQQVTSELILVENSVQIPVDSLFLSCEEKKCCEKLLEMRQLGYGCVKRTENESGHVIEVLV